MLKKRWNDFKNIFLNSIFVMLINLRISFFTYYWISFHLKISFFYLVLAKAIVFKISFFALFWLRLLFLKLVV